MDVLRKDLQLVDNVLQRKRGLRLLDSIIYYLYVFMRIRVLHLILNPLQNVSHDERPT